MSERLLLAELHAHSTWSDGALSIAELVDLHGRNGFDVLCVTDHALRSDDRWRAQGARSVDEHAHDAYLGDIEHEARRALDVYGLLLLPGLEVTINDLDPDRAAHALAVGLRTFVSPDAGLVPSLRAARAAGAAVIAAHPHGAERDAFPGRTTRRFWREPELEAEVDRFELFNRDSVFSWVAEARIPAVACGDFHRPEHLASWKTLLPCARSEEAVVGFLRSPRPAYLCPFRPALAAPERAAA